MRATEINLLLHEIVFVFFFFFVQFPPDVASSILGFLTNHLCRLRRHILTSLSLALTDQLQIQPLIFYFCLFPETAIFPFLHSP